MLPPPLPLMLFRCVRNVPLEKLGIACCERDKNLNVCSSQECRSGLAKESLGHRYDLPYIVKVNFDVWPYWKLRGIQVIDRYWVQRAARIEIMLMDHVIGSLDLHGHAGLAWGEVGGRGGVRAC